MSTKVIRLLPLALIGMLVFLFTPGQILLAQSTEPSLSINSLSSLSCNEWGPIVQISADGGGEPFRVGDRVVVNGVVFMDNFDPTWTSPYNGGWGATYLNNQGGAVSPNPWPIPTDTPFTWYVIMEQPIGTPVITLALKFDKCNGGSLQSVTDATDSPAFTASPSGDPDGDGIETSKDNCPYDYNPDQEDGWGSQMGDICDTEWYNRTGDGMAGFVQKDGMYHLHGNCIYLEDGAPRCPVIAAFDSSIFDPTTMPIEITSGDAGTWSVWLHYLHSNNGADVYQINTYSTNPPQPETLVDDRLEIHVNAGHWEWYQRGGHSSYHGN